MTNVVPVKNFGTRLFVLGKISVDFHHENSFVVTLVSRLARIDHHFFLDFIFH